MCFIYSASVSSIERAKHILDLCLSSSQFRPVKMHLSTLSGCCWSFGLIFSFVFPVSTGFQVLSANCICFVCLIPFPLFGHRLSHLYLFNHLIVVLPGQVFCYKSVTPSSCPRACFSKVSKLFWPVSGATIPLTFSQRSGSKPSNFAILLVFLACSKRSAQFSKQADCSLTTGFPGPKRSWDFRETGIWPKLIKG